MDKATQETHFRQRMLKYAAKHRWDREAQW